MSWTTAGEIVLFLIGAALLGGLIGFVFGVQSKLVRSWTVARDRTDDAVARVREQCQAETEIERTRADTLQAQLEQAYFERERWVANHDRLVDEIARMSQLTPEVLVSKPDVHEYVDEQLREMSKMLPSGGNGNG